MRNTTLMVLMLAVAMAVSAAMGLQAEAGTTELHSWDTKINDGSKRFVVLADFNNEAVLDRETGLVWEKSPDTDSRTWEASQIHCNTLTTGGRLGWRLPTIQELASLIDPTQTNPSLPSGHPFSENVLSDQLFFSTTSDTDTSNAWIAAFGLGTVAPNYSKTAISHAWCVRGGQGVDPQ
jgi:hypothetical protein